MPTVVTADAVLAFWFNEIQPKQWFTKSDAFDAQLRDRFAHTVRAALDGMLDEWANDGRGCLALILCLDQFTRNIYRGSPDAFAGDAKCVSLSQRCVTDGYLKAAPPAHRTFMLMPMMHSEELSVQEASLPLFLEYTPTDTYEYAVKHRDIVARFGRFPHRNAVLGRDSTSQELEFLTQPGSSF